MPYIIALAVLVVIGVGFALFQNSNTEKESLDTTAITVEERIPAETATTTDFVATEPTPETPTIPVDTIVSTPTTKPEIVVGALDYVDGTYTTAVTYMTPKKDEYLLDVTFTIANDVVIDTDIVYSQGAEKDPNAQRFEAAYEAVVIGKDIDTLNLSRVGGASLTTGAFNKALANIKLDAGA